MLLTAEPRPICFAFTPPVVPAPVPLAAAAALMVSLYKSLKVTVLFLKPTVFTLAMLLPITSMRVWWLRSPVTPENNERII